MLVSICYLYVQNGFSSLLLFVALRMADGEAFVTTKSKYLQQLCYLKSTNLGEEFDNCMTYRVLLYSLREQLLIFVEKQFEEFIKHYQLCKKSSAEIIKFLVRFVRTTVPSDKDFERKAKQRIVKINQLQEKQFTAISWQSVAGCFTERFVRGLNVTFDPKDLLEIFIFCNFFPLDICSAAFKVRSHRNEFDGHLFVLLIDAKTLQSLKGAIDTLLFQIENYGTKC